MKKKLVWSVALVLTAAAAVVTSFATTQSPAQSAKPVAQSNADWVRDAQTKLAATFTHLKFERVSASQIPGVVEIYAGPRIIYYAPEPQILILGEMYDSSGSSITEQRIAAYAAEKIPTLDKESALVVGEGAKELIAFVDPDCGYCRKAIEWLSTQTLSDTRQLFFFMPTPGRPSAQARAIRALCAPPSQRAEALRAAFEASAAAGMEEVTQCPGVQARLNRHAQMAQNLGVYASPFFVVDKQIIAGFDAERLQRLLGTSPNESH